MICVDVWIGRFRVEDEDADHEPEPTASLAMPFGGRGGFAAAAV
jgi:hypothetical protein